MLGNFLFISFVIFLPFSIALMGKYISSVVAAVVIAGNVLLIVASYNFLFFISCIMKLRDEQYRVPHLLIPTVMRYLMELIIVLITFAVSFFSAPATIAGILLLPAIEILASVRLDFFFWAFRFAAWIYERRTSKDM
jgi:uncharacterized membrane protein